jgi:hypothetical protein
MRWLNQQCIDLRHAPIKEAGNRAEIAEVRCNSESSLITILRSKGVKTLLPSTSDDDRRAGAFEDFLGQCPACYLAFRGITAVMKEETYSGCRA